MSWDKYIRYVSAGLGSIIAFLFGGWDWWMIALVSAIALDYISGIIAALLEKKLNSKKGFEGLLKKTLYLIIVAVACILDTALKADGAIRGLVIGYLIANEGLSILENCARCGAPVPKKLVDALEQLRGDDKDDEKKL